jgi:Leucine-rich repeat (LRR) protein
MIVELEPRETRASSPRSSSRYLLSVALCLCISSCDKTWPKNVDELGGDWPIPASEVRALEALARASKLGPKRFQIWNEDQDTGRGRGATIRAGHVSKLYLPDSGLRSLSAVSGLPHLVAINVNRNQLTALEGVAKLSQLLYLRAGRNPIARVDRLDQLVNLTVLNLSETRLKSLEQLGKIPAKATIFLGGKLPKLTVEAGAGPAGLTLYSPTSPLDTSGLRSQKKLVYLRVQKPSAPLNLEDVCANKALRVLKIYGSPRVSLAGLAGCSALKELELIFCKKLDVATLPSLPALERLELLGSRMGNLPLPHLPALQQLSINVRQPGLTSLAGLDGAKLPKLRSLRIMRGDFPSLDLRGRFEAMRELKISHAKISSLRGLIAFPRLTTLTIFSTNLASLGSELAETTQASGRPAEAPGPNVERTTQRRKAIKTTKTTKTPKGERTSTKAPRTVATSRPARLFAYLHTIRATKSKIARLNGLAAIAPALRKLVLAKNALTTLRGLEGAKKLRFLEVQRNRITTLAALHGLALYSLQAYGNRLTSAAPVVVKGKRTSSLTYLDLRENPLRDLPSSQRYYNQSSGRSIRGSSRYGSGGGGYRSGK